MLSSHFNSWQQLSVASCSKMKGSGPIGWCAPTRTSRVAVGTYLCDVMVWSQRSEREKHSKQDIVALGHQKEVKQGVASLAWKKVCLMNQAALRRRATLFWVACSSPSAGLKAANKNRCATLTVVKHVHVNSWLKHTVRIRQMERLHTLWTAWRNFSRRQATNAWKKHNATRFILPGGKLLLLRLYK